MLLRQHEQEFEHLVQLVGDEVRAHRPDNALVLSELAALSATWHHTGWFASPELESLIGSVGLDVGEGRAAARRSIGVERVLHVSTLSGPLGGVSRMIPRWIALDRHRRHDVVLTRQAHRWLSPRLRREVRSSGGRIHRLDLRPSGPRAQARRLRQIATEADLILLHVETDDAMPTLAFQDWSGAPILFVNHADHAFWLDATVADAVVNLRAAGRDLAVERRGFGLERSWVLPTPLEERIGGVPRVQARQGLGLSEREVVMVSVARATKFEARGGLHFAELHRPVLEQVPDSHLVVVGPGPDASWAAIADQFPGRVTVVGETPQTSGYLDAADVYVDSFPFTSITSLLEAALRGLPVVSFSPWSPQSAIFECGAPGLDGALLMERDPDRYAAAVSELLEDRREREQRARDTQLQVARQHTGDGWRTSVSALYADALSLPARGKDPITPTHSIGEPDSFVARVFGREPGLSEHLLQRLGVLPTASRVAAWSVLRTGGGASLAALAPEAVTSWRHWAKENVARVRGTSLPG